MKNILQFRKSPDSEAYCAQQFTTFNGWMELFHLWFNIEVDEDGKYIPSIKDVNDRFFALDTCETYEAAVDALETKYLDMVDTLIYCLHSIKDKAEAESEDKNFSRDMRIFTLDNLPVKKSISFYDYLMSKYHVDAPIGDLAHDVKHDSGFKSCVTLRQVVDYLEDLEVEPDVIDAAVESYSMYVHKLINSGC